MKDMTQLFYFRTVAQLQHITKAAEELHISQPNLSNAIKRLERALGAELFDRKNGRIFLNEYGKVYLEAVNNAFDILDTAEQKIQIMQAENQDNRISIASTMQHYNEQLVDAYLEDHPGDTVSFSQNVISMDQIFKQFWDDQLDIAFVPNADFPPIVKWQECFQCRVGVLMSGNYPLASRHDLTIEDLRDEPFICNNLGIPKEKIIQVCETAGFSPRFVFESNDSASVGKRLAAGKGISLVSSYDLMLPLTNNADNLIALPLISSAPTVAMGLAVRSDKLEKSKTRHFYEYAKKYYRQLGDTVDVFWKSYFHIEE